MPALSARHGADDRRATAETHGRETYHIPSPLRSRRRMSITMILCCVVGAAVGCSTPDAADAPSGPDGITSPPGCCPAPTAQPSNDPGPSSGGARDSGTRGSLPAGIVGEWDGMPSGGAADGYAFTADGAFTSFGAFNGSARTCAGTAAVQGSSLRLDAAGCGSRTISWRVDGNVLTLDGSAYIRRGITADSAECLLGPWHLNGGRMTVPGTGWGVSEDVVLESLPDPATGGSETLHFGSDGSVSEKSDALVWYAPGIALRLRVTADSHWTGDYRVSGSTISYADWSGSYRYVFERDGTVVNEAADSVHLVPDRFTCNRTRLELTGDGYEYSYWRG